MTRIDRIYEGLLPLMEEHEIEDTPTNRRFALSVFRECWLKANCRRFNGEKLLYLFAIDLEITRLYVEMPFKK